MSKLSHFGVGVALLLFVLFWFVFGIFMYVGYGAFGFRVDAHVALWAAIFLISIWSTFSAFKRAWRAPRSDSQPEVLTPPPSQPQPSLATPDEKLARLVKKQDDEPVA